LLFGFDSYAIPEDNKVFLEEVRSKMEKHDSLVIKVVGYTDALGSENYNLRLSKQRAQVVANYLISKTVDKNRVRVIARGEADPIALNENADGSDNPAGRKYNRRVELVPENKIAGLVIISSTDIPENLLQK
jgi:outer membrane protein OmpA-like peptidoglycan-associated protein